MALRSSAHPLANSAPFLCEPLALAILPTSDMSDLHDVRGVRSKRDVSDANDLNDLGDLLDPRDTHDMRCVADMYDMSGGKGTPDRRDVYGRSDGLAGRRIGRVGGIGRVKVSNVAVEAAIVIPSNMIMLF